MNERHDDDDGDVCVCVCTHIILLGGEGAHAHAGGVGFDHAVHPAHVRGRHAQAGAHAPDGAVGGRDERVRP